MIAKTVHTIDTSSKCGLFNKPINNKEVEEIHINDSTFIAINKVIDSKKVSGMSILVFKCQNRIAIDFSVSICRSRFFTNINSPMSL